MAYWVYENWTAESKAVVHHGRRAYCNEGRGWRDNPLGNKNGRWHGPFPTASAATKAAVATGRPARHCCRCTGQ